MKKEKQIESWLNGSLKGQDLNDFKQSNTYQSIQRIDDTARLFKAPDFDEVASKASIDSTKMKNSKSKQKTIYYKFAGIAAVFLFSFFIAYQFFSASDVAFETASNEEQIITLPDDSKVYLNSHSKLTYSDADFENNRKVYLEGEAFFMVNKGLNFSVVTPVSQIEVLGTSFNVKSRANFSEVDCYTGKVKVTDSQQNEAVLTSLERFSNYDGSFQVSNFSNKEPGWIGLQKSNFNSTPLSVVLTELAAQYQIQIDASAVDTSVYFSGSFTHSDLENALKSITLPLQIDFEIQENQVTLQKE